MTDETTTTGDRAVLAARDIRVAYDSDAKRLVLDGVSVSVKPGEFVALIGPNGSGKSSLIRSLSRTLRPKGGVVSLDGDDLYGAVSARAAALRVGVVPQETSVAFEFTVREIVAMGRAPHQKMFSIGGESPADSAAIDKALQRADIDLAFSDRLISSLSGGERQRVLIARALAQEAEILLLDEPTASLDIRHETDLLSWLRNLAAQEGRAVLAALHDLNLAGAYADRVVVLKSGRVYAVGTPSEILTKETIAAVYGVDAWVGSHPVSGRPYYLPIPPAVAADASGIDPTGLANKGV